MKRLLRSALAWFCLQHQEWRQPLHTAPQHRHYSARLDGVMRRAPCKPIQCRCLMRFRLCCWPIAAYRDHHLPRNARLCPLCNKGVEDERHVLLECEAYTCVRSTYGISSDSMKQVMQGADQFKLACCVRDIWSKRCLLIRQHHDGAHGVQDATNNPRLVSLQVLGMHTSNPITHTHHGTRTRGRRGRERIENEREANACPGTR